MGKVAYAKSARWYDIFIEPLIRALRTTGLAMFPPHRGMTVLDIGCGTGTHLSLYQKAGCKTFGIDLSPAMLSVARQKLGATAPATLTLGDASRMPFPDGSFDLVTATLMFHEMPAALRSPVMGEAKRVVKKHGRFLVIDYHPGAIHFPEGWFAKTLITCIESLASEDHSRNYQDFMDNTGLAPLIAENGLLVDEQRIVGGGTIGLYLLRPPTRG
ncbi:MAG: class I SAM-dependent methyltransferase [Anaerolineae bacterium]|nr:class I SAM-dependent methyltransferase [Anaerolineae bacterium]